MAEWTQARERTRRMRKALQLLTVSGAVRPASLEPRYFAPERTMATSSCDPQLAASRIEKSEASIWSMDLKSVWYGWRKSTQQSERLRPQA